MCLMYAFFCTSSYVNFEIKVRVIFFLLTGIILVAVWASLVNNYYDVEVDVKAGKPNGMTVISPFLRKLSLVFCLMVGLIFCNFIMPNKIAVLFYSLSWICFFLYSSNITRFKEKPFFDLLSDGLASQFFPSLFIFAYLFGDNFGDNYFFIFSGSFWLLLSMGVRALIMHQYCDEEKDRQAGLNTYVLGTNVTIRKKVESFLMIFEVVFFAIFALSIHWVTLIIPILLYGIWFLVLIKHTNLKIVYFNLNVGGRYRIFLYNAYVLFVFCLLGFLCWQDYKNIIFVFLHLFLFHFAIVVKMWQSLKLNVY